MKPSIIALALPLACLCTGCSIASAQDASDPPVGLWVWSTAKSADTVSLTIAETADGWIATVGDDRVPVSLESGTIAFKLKDESRFVGKQSPDGAEIRGLWHQPPAAFHYQKVATPVTLQAMDSGGWHAAFAIQPRPYRVFLDIFEDAKGEFAAVVRNPEGNDTLRATRFALESEDRDDWALVQELRSGTVRHSLDRVAPNQLVLEHDVFDTPITLHPALGDLTEGYYSRRPDAERRGMMADARDDGWTVATPQEAGFDAQALAAITRQLAQADVRSPRPQLIHSLLISRRGKLVYEEYFYGHDRGSRHDVRSLGKVFGSVMVGALQQQGRPIDASHRPIAALLQRAGRTMDDPRKADITLKDLMTYSSGLDCDVNSPSSAGSEGRMWEQNMEPDYWLFTATLPMLHAPGDRYAYCSGSANLVGASLNAFDDRPVHVLFDDLIAKPLQFGPYHWPLAPTDEGYLGGGMYMLPRDILKIGAMYAAGGQWNGEQIVSESWIEESTSAHLAINPETTGMTPEEFQNNYFGGSQGYIWGVDTISVGERTFKTYQASGNGGQLLIVVPKLELAVAFTGGNYRQGWIWGRWRDAIVSGQIIPAITDLDQVE